MYWPAGIKPGSSYDDLVQNIDYTPTFLELAGVKLKSVTQLDGVSLKPNLMGDNKAIHDYLFFELGFARGVMTKDWKYITVRYDEESEQQVADGAIFTGWNGHKYKQPYYIRNTHLGYHAALLNEHYFERKKWWPESVSLAVASDSSGRQARMPMLRLSIVPNFRKEIRMLDIKTLRDNPETAKTKWASRGLDVDVDAILAKDERRRALIVEMEELLKIVIWPVEVFPVAAHKGLR